MMSRKNLQPRIVARTKGGEEPLTCWVCEQEVDVDYKDVQLMNSFLSPRGRILGKKVTGVCAKHQRKLSTAVKRARQMALI